MYRKLIYFGILMLFASSAFAQESLQLNTIVIDAGHGGKDPGALGKFMKEKDITLSVALKFGNLIKENMPEVKVIFTRNSDVFVPLDKRAAIANKNKANLFVSIHANWISKPTIHGAETFILGLHRNQSNLEVAKKENSVILLEEDYATKYEGFDPESSESYIIFEMIQGRHRDHSIDIASKIQDKFTSAASRYDRGVKEAGFLVLHQTAAPSILVELGFLSNAEEEKYLASSDGQNKLAAALFQAFREYKNHYDAQSDVAKINGDSSKTVTETKSPVTSEVVTVKNRAQVIYKVQIASSATKYAKGRGVLAKFPDAQYYMDNKLYKYTVGDTDDFDKIKTMHQKVKATIPDCFIIAFYNGKRITIQEAQRISQKW